MNLSAIQAAFPQDPIPDVSAYYSERIRLWRDIFENNPPWLKVKRGGLYKKGDRSRYTLSTAKVLCDHFSALTFSEQCSITVSNEQYQSYIDQQLERNGFWDNMPLLLTDAYALGGGVVKVYADQKHPQLSYIHAEQFLPTGWDSKTVLAGDFVSTTRSKEYYYTLVERHQRGRITHKLFQARSNGEVGTPCPLSTLYAFPEQTDYQTDTPMFAYFKPCVSNNAEYDTPLGMSIYANALSTLEALDIAFDSFVREFLLGKKRIIVPASAIQTVVDPTSGELVRYFDADDEAFVALKADDTKEMKITDNTITLRIEEHVAGINALLNILCFQVGLSPGSLSFDAVQGLKTATEIISQDSKTARTVKSNKNLLTEAIETIIHALIAVGIFLKLIPQAEYTVTVGWQDNIVIDDNTLIDNNIKLVDAGLKSKVKAIMDVQKCDEAEALAELERIAKEQSVGGLAVDDFLSSRKGEGDDTSGTDAVE